MNLFALAQNFVPQQHISTLAGHLAQSQNRYLKTALIMGFAKAYDIQLDDYKRERLDEYDSFNDFFTRELKDGLRPIDDDPTHITSPADGKISQLGTIKDGQLLQAKGRDYDVGQLLADYELGKTFADGSFVTIYLAPTNYHRVHMPFDGTLTQSCYVPGTLFSVNNTTARHVPDLFARNERLICHFETQFGRACVVLVGAMIVAGIECVATGAIKRTSDIQQRTHRLSLKKGQELGRFYLGSTAIVILPKSAHASWQNQLTHGSQVRMGQTLGKLTGTVQPTDTKHP